MIARLSCCFAAVSLLCSAGVAQNLVVNGDFETAANFVGGPSNPDADKKFFASALPLAWSNAPGSGSNYTYLCSPRTADGPPSTGAPIPTRSPSSVRSRSQARAVRLPSPVMPAATSSSKTPTRTIMTR